jgi:hypothetical protein
MKENNDELDPREVAALGLLAREKTPPDFLEQRVLAALRQSQLIRPSSFGWQRRLVMAGSAIAAAAALFILGAASGAWWKSPPAVSQNLPKFMLVLRNSPGELPPRSADEELQRVHEYSGWAKKMDKEGVILEGEKLKDEARVLNVIDTRLVVSDLAEDTKKTAIAGYFLIRAHDYQQAITIAQNCPHLNYGGTIEIRQIDSIGQQSN